MRRAPWVGAGAMALAIAVALGAAACGNGNNEPSSTAQPPAAAQSPAAATPQPSSASLKAYVYDPPRTIADFTLTGQDGKPVRFSDTNGKVRVVYIGYTSCPDICPTTMMTWKNMKKELGEQAGDVSFMMITADPERDTPAVMGAFLRAYDPAFIGLSGSRAELAPVWTSFGAHISREELPDSAAGYAVSHPASLFVFLKDGRAALQIPYGEPAPQAAEEVRGLLR